MAGTGKTHTILVVDDQERLRKGLARSFSQEDFRTLTAASGEEALRLLKGGEIDLVVTDLVMPGMDGMTLVRNIKSTDPGIKIIIITAYGSAESMQEAEELGVACYLAKPFDLSDLKSRVNELLAGVTRGRASTALGPAYARPTHAGGNCPAFSRARAKPDASCPAFSRAPAKPDASCPGGHWALCSICRAPSKALRAVVGLPRRALPHIRPRNVMRTLGRAARAVSGFASVFTK